MQRKAFHCEVEQQRICVYEPPALGIICTDYAVVQFTFVGGL